MKHYCSRPPAANQAGEHGLACLPDPIPESTVLVVQQSVNCP